MRPRLPSLRIAYSTFDICVIQLLLQLPETSATCWFTSNPERFVPPLSALQSSYLTLLRHLVKDTKQRRAVYLPIVKAESRSSVRYLNPWPPHSSVPI
jgi:hypothetical protein